jgi:hypothetical protein
MIDPMWDNFRAGFAAGVVVVLLLEALVFVVYKVLK